MKILHIAVLIAVGGLTSAHADRKKQPTLTGVEIAMSVGIYGGGSCYFGSGGSVVYQRIVPDRKAGHGMIEKRYVMTDSLAMSWDRITKNFDILKILNSRRKTDTGVAGESSFKLRAFFSDGTSKKRWAFTDDPITGLWMQMREAAWDQADAEIPEIIPYEQVNFGNLRRYLNESNKSE